MYAYTSKHLYPILSACHLHYHYEYLISIQSFAMTYHALYCSVLYHTITYCIILYYTILYTSWWSMEPTSIYQKEMDGLHSCSQLSMLVDGWYRVVQCNVMQWRRLLLVTLHCNRMIYLSSIYRLSIYLCICNCSIL